MQGKQANLTVVEDGGYCLSPYRFCHILSIFFSLGKEKERKGEGRRGKGGKLQKLEGVQRGRT